MVSERVAMIGFSQRVRMEWLEDVAQMVADGQGWETIHAVMDDRLSRQVSVSGQARRGNRQKILTILKRTWVTPPPAAKPLQPRALQLLRQLPRAGHLPLHWGMVTASYPFWGVVADQVGRLLKLQGTVTAAQVQRRIREQYGDRETVKRALRRVLRSYHDWEVLVETVQKGIYTASRPRCIESPELTGWLIESLLRAGIKPAISRRSVSSVPCLFAFDVGDSPLIRESKLLEVSADGAGEEWFALAQS